MFVVPALAGFFGEKSSLLPAKAGTTNFARRGGVDNEIVLGDKSAGGAKA